MKQSRNIFICGMCILFMFYSHSFAKVEDYEVMLQRGFYQQEVLGQPIEALESYQSVLSGEHVSQDLLPIAFYRTLSCLLKLHRHEEAKQLYRRFAESFDSSNTWVAAANEIVPASFKVKHLPWVDDETAIYKWTTDSGELVGFSAVSTSLIEKDGSRFWSLESHMIGDAYRHYRVDFEETSLVPSFSFYRMRRKDPLEERWMAAFITVDHMDIDSEWDHETVGYLLRQYSMGVGFKTQDDFFKPSEGMPLRGELDVSYVETQSHSNSRQSRFHVDMDLEGVDQEYWIENSDEHHLLKFRAGELLGERVFAWVGRERQDALNYPFSFGNCVGKRFGDWRPVPIENNDSVGIVFLLSDQSKSLSLRTFKTGDNEGSLIAIFEKMNAHFSGELLVSTDELDELSVEFPSAFWSVAKIVGKRDQRYAVWGCVEVNGQVVQINASCEEQDLTSFIKEISKLVRTLEVNESR